MNIHKHQTLPIYTTPSSLPTQLIAHDQQYPASPATPRHHTAAHTLPHTRPQAVQTAAAPHTPNSNPAYTAAHTPALASDSDSENTPSASFPHQHRPANSTPDSPPSHSYYSSSAARSLYTPLLGRARGGGRTCAGRRCRRGLFRHWSYWCCCDARARSPGRRGGQ
ncbi:hypothetical protein BDV96DRAFT_571129 [Lophiotrema nucula]|uniref:Uncharacterized protein n=1 Tax=Lophiotrema nucula TaxID=690887 RepID=A0A6A5ZEM4_9PLEO|nr:hypothetical protein BDV96DRAFT_571129 [Lophiotrema nucula]